MCELEKMYNKFSFNVVKKFFLSFQFEIYLKVFGFDSFDIIIVVQFVFLCQVNELMGEYLMENWKFYLEWKMFNYYVGFMGSDWEQLNFGFYGKVLFGKKEMKFFNECVIDCIIGLLIGELFGRLFVEQVYFKEV